MKRKNKKEKKEKIAKAIEEKKNKSVSAVRKTRATSQELADQQILEENQEKNEEKEVIGYSACPECGSKNLARDKGEIYCKDCGYVLEESEE
jgi:ribosomal protein S27AE